jgi:hypothetical protein
MSVFTAELAAIHMAIHHLQKEALGKYLSLKVLTVLTV